MSGTAEGVPFGGLGLKSAIGGGIVTGVGSNRLGMASIGGIVGGSKFGGRAGGFIVQSTAGEGDDCAVTSVVTCILVVM